jgi:hypothetical protein
MQVEHLVLLEFVVLLLAVLLVLLKLFEPLVEQVWVQLVVLPVLILVDPFFCKLESLHLVARLA